MSKVFDIYGQPKKVSEGYKLKPGESCKPFFPGYSYEFGKSYYKNILVGEGGYVYAEPGMYGNVAVLDVASMHPTSIIQEELFGAEYTSIFRDLVQARVAIKHEDYDTAKKMLGGKLAPYLDDPKEAKGLSNALKIAINSVYGLTAAKFSNPFRDVRNVDNIVAKRGALFMINLLEQVQKMGFRAAHIKTDSIKIPDATPGIIDFVVNYGKDFGYTFEHEGTYERFCLVNDAVFIARFASEALCRNLYGDIYVDSSPDTLKDNKRRGNTWEAVGAQFQVSYVFKKLFSHEEIEFSDLCETKQVTSSIHIQFGDEEPRFIGRVGLFCPVISGGGTLLRKSEAKDGTIKYDALSGTKGYQWLESKDVESLNLQDKIDISYYDKLVDEAKKTMAEQGDYEWFMSDRPYEPVDAPNDLPPWD